MDGINNDNIAFKSSKRKFDESVVTWLDCPSTIDDESIPEDDGNTIDAEPISMINANEDSDESDNDGIYHEWVRPSTKKMVELLASDLTHTYRNVMENVVKAGFSWGSAWQAFCMLNFKLWNNDKNITEEQITSDILKYLNGEMEDSRGRGYMFLSMRKFIDHTITEMVYVVMEMKEVTLSEALNLLAYVGVFNFKQIARVDTELRYLPLLSESLGQSSSGGAKGPTTSKAIKTKTWDSKLHNWNFFVKTPNEGEKMEFIYPKDIEDELVLELRSRLLNLNKEKQWWKDWTSNKITLTQKMSEEFTEVKRLKNDFVKVYQRMVEKQERKDNMQKQLSALEADLFRSNKNADRSIVMLSTLQLRIIEDKIAKNDAEMKACEEFQRAEAASEAEKIVVDRLQAAEMKKSVMLEELEKINTKISQLHIEVKKAADMNKKVEARMKTKKIMKEKNLAKVASLRTENKQSEDAVKAEQQRIMSTAEKDMKTVTQEITQLENKLAEIKLEDNKDDIILQLRRNIGKSYKGEGASRGSKKLLHFRSIMQCYMCLVEEKTVIMLPCGHQVLCKDCNGIHEKKLGSSNCPSCGAHIEKRIHPRFRGD
ncbi:hypothetical protein ACFE04_015516 [Oxalis oulophora]